MSLGGEPMNARVLQFDASAHRAADALLPWLVNGTLEGDERLAVERHVRECALCRREVDALQRLQAACALYEPLPDATASWQRIAARLGPPPRHARWRPRLHRWLAPWQRAPRWARLAILAEFAALASLLVWIGAPMLEPAASYETLGTPAAHTAAPGSIAVVFAPGVTEAQMRRVVQGAGARVVDGPTQANAYVLAVPAGTREHALAALRADPAVALAQPLTAQPDR